MLDLPPRIKVTQEYIIDIAFQIVREKGLDHLNARDLAKEIGCSVHPIFRAFETMEGLKVAVYQRAEQFYNKWMLDSLEAGNGGFLAMGLTYIDFAKNEKNLFKLIFMSDAFREQSMMDIVNSTEGDDQVVSMICQMTGLTASKAKDLYASIWLTTHGIASMFATNNCRFSDEEINRILSNTFMGLIMKLKTEDKN